MNTNQSDKCTKVEQKLHYELLSAQAKLAALPRSLGINDDDLLALREHDSKLTEKVCKPLVDALEIAIADMRGLAMYLPDIADAAHVFVRKIQTALAKAEATKNRVLGPIGHMNRTQTPRIAYKKFQKVPKSRTQPKRFS